MSDPSPNPRAAHPTWSTSLGILAVLFGTMFAAVQGNELLLQSVIAPGTAAVQNVPVECRKDEAEQEGVSVAECELMVANVRIMIVSRPPWYRQVQVGLTLVATLVGFGSILVGVALVDARPWAPAMAVAAFTALLALDAAGFTAAFYTGPLLRAVYLWSTTFWLCIHLCMTAGVLVGREAGLAQADAPRAAA